MTPHSHRHSVAAWLLVAAAGSSAAFAQGATRTWVSGVGDDLNPCSRTAPCKTFAGAISKTAAGGEIDALDPGGFGAVTIGKSLTIDGGGFASSILVGGTNGIIINALATDTVTLRNISFEGAGTGLDAIRILQAGAVHIQNVAIESFTGFGVHVENGVAAVQVSIEDSAINNCGGASTGGGVRLHPGGSATASLEMHDTEFFHNRAGLVVEDRGKATVRATDVSSSTNFGYHAKATSAAAEIHLKDSVAANNSAAGVRSEGALATIRLDNVSVHGNGTGLASVSGGAILSFGNNQVTGNTANGAPTGPAGSI